MPGPDMSIMFEDLSPHPPHVRPPKTRGVVIFPVKRHERFEVGLLHGDLSLVEGRNEFLQNLLISSTCCWCNFYRSGRRSGMMTPNGNHYSNQHIHDYAYTGTLHDHPRKQWRCH